MFDLLGSSGLLLVDVTNSEGSKGLHETSSVIASWGISKCKHGLGEFSVELGLGVAQGRLNIDKLLEVVEVSVHLNNLAVSSEVLFTSVGHLESRSRGRKLGWSWGPVDGGSLVEEVAWVEVSNTILLDASDTKSLLVFLVKLGWEDLDDHVSILLLGVNVGIEVGLAGLDGSQDGLERVSTLFHVTLDLPVQLDLIGDVKVKGEVEKITNTIVVHGVKTFENDDGGWFDGLGGVKGSVDVVVDGLGNSLSVLQGLDLLVHEVEVVLKRVKGSQSSNLAAVTVVQVVVIKADDSGKVRDQGVSFPSSVSEATSKRSDDITSEDGGQTAHESGLSASRVSGNTDNDGSLTGLQCHVEAAGGSRDSGILGGESRRGESSNSGEGGEGEGELHCRCLSIKVVSSGW